MSDTKEQALYASLYRRYLKQPNSFRQISTTMVARGWEDRRMRAYRLMSTEVLSAMMEMFWKGIVLTVHNDMSACNTTSLNT